MTSAPYAPAYSTAGTAANQWLGYLTGYGSGVGTLAPYAQATFNSNYTNPYAGGYQQSAADASGFYRSLAGTASDTAGTVNAYALGAIPSYGVGFLTQDQNQASAIDSAASAIPGIATQALTQAQQNASGIMPLAQKVADTAFDPQNALYARTQQQLSDQVNAQLAAMGLSTSGAGAGIADQALSNFNIDWQNAQLQRQVQGLGAYDSAAGTAQNIESSGYGNYGSLLGTYGGLLTDAANIRQTGLNGFLGTLSAAEGAGTNAAQLYGSAAGAALSAGQVPYQTYGAIGSGQTGAINDYLSFLNSAYPTGAGLDSGYLNYYGNATNAYNQYQQQQLENSGGLFSGLLSGASSLFGGNSSNGGILGSVFGNSGGGGFLSNLFGGGSAASSALGLADVSSAAGVAGDASFLSDVGPLLLAA